MSKTVTKGWKTAAYDDSLWTSSKVKPLGCNFYYWSDWIAHFQNISGTTATPVWKDSCNDVKTKNYFRVVVSLPETHIITVKMAVDNDFILDINGQVFNETGSTWSNIKTFDAVVIGKGPWVVTVKARDTGIVAGLMGAVYIDGVLVSATGLTSPRLRPFKMSKTKSKGWKTAAYDDSLWTSSRVKPLGCDFFYWAEWIARFQEITKTKATPVWKDSCNDVLISNYFRLVLTDNDRVHCVRPRV